MKQVCKYHCSLAHPTADLGITDYYLVSKSFSETERTIFPMFI